MYPLFHARKPLYEPQDGQPEGRQGSIWIRAPDFGVRYRFPNKPIMNSEF